MVGRARRMRDAAMTREGIVMTKQNEYRRQLVAARDKLVDERRDMAVVLSNPDKRGKTERVRVAFKSIQGSIEALERAIVHEQKLAGTLQPPTVA
jgi:hypothetical protein